MKNVLFTSILTAFLLLPIIVSAHPGRTDSYGCHTCRTNCAKWGLSTGEYHCHQAKTLPQPVEPIKSHYAPTGGYTTPAPEYTAPKQEVKKVVVPKVETKTTPVLNTNNDKEKALVSAIENMPKTTEVEKISLFTKIFRLIFGN